jgi:hypothetical protein
MLTQTVNVRSGDEFSTVTTQEVRAELIRHDEKKVGSVAHDPLLLRRFYDGQIKAIKVNGESMRCNCWIHRLLRRPRYGSDRGLFSIFFYPWSGSAWAEGISDMFRIRRENTHGRPQLLVTMTG